MSDNKWNSVNGHSIVSRETDKMPPQDPQHDRIRAILNLDYDQLQEEIGDALEKFVNEKEMFTSMDQAEIITDLLRAKFG